MGATRQEPDQLYFASASLDRVASTEVFLDRTKTSCRGILIRYEDGTERALGQCRVGVDPSEACVRPQQIRYLDVSWALIEEGLNCRTAVEFRSAETHVSVKKDWLCSNMEGYLKFWFNEDVGMVRVD